MKLILALALGATAQFATPALRGGARRLEALELLGAEESAKVEAEQEAQRAKALEEAMAQLKEAQAMMDKAKALKAAAATAEAAPEAPKEPAAAEAPAEERVAVAAPMAGGIGVGFVLGLLYASQRRRPVPATLYRVASKDVDAAGLADLALAEVV